MVTASIVQRVAPLLCAVQLGEALARDIARAQAAIAPTPRLARALGHQSLQEALHSKLFRAALQCIPGQHSCPPRIARSLAAYRSRLEADIRAGNLLGSMIGLQFVFEGLGPLALQPPAGPLAAVCDRLVPLRWLILRQEEAHHRMGLHWTARLASSPDATAGHLQGYLDEAQEVADAGLESVDTQQLDSDHYRRAVQAHFSALRGAAGADVARFDR